ncbi:MAG TPA: hypothetical protein VM165_07865 [Planctomycetaceae bacterium]|nr:hypothetical protein [Planctomycetaceae bacterium]
MDNDLDPTSDSKLLRYLTGEEIRIDDHIRYAAKPGRVVFVVNSRQFSDEFPENQWAYLGGGFMVAVNDWGLIHLDEADEDLDFIRRGDEARSFTTDH